MLKLIKIKDPSLKLAFLNKFSPKETQVIVSDLKNQAFLSQEWLKKQAFLEGPCVLRANEYYKLLFESLNNRWAIQPDSFIKSLLAEFLLGQKSQKIKNLAYSELFFEFLQVGFPFFLHHSEFFKDWFFNQKPAPFPHYWFEPEQTFCEKLNSSNTAFESAIKSLLWDQLIDSKACESTTGTKNLKILPKNLVLDLAYSLDFCEKEIFKELSKHTKVFVLSPDLQAREPLLNPKDFCLYKEWEKELIPSQIELLSKDLSPYRTNPPDKEDITGQKESSANPPDKENTTGQRESSANPPDKGDIGGLKQSEEKQFFQVESESQWMEIKKAVTQVHKWLDKGIPPQQISLYAPNMEQYWLPLRSYLEKESLPFKKSLQADLSSFPDIRYLLSALRLHLGTSSFEDLEAFCFHKASKKNFSQFYFENFRVGHKSRLSRYLFQKQIKNPQQQTIGREFVEWLLSFCSKDFSKKTEEALLSVLSQLPPDKKLSWQSWLKLFEELLLKEKLELKEEKEGLSCLSFNAFHSNKSPYVFLLGLTEKAFQSQGLINESTAKSLLNDLGVPVAIPPPQKQKNNLLWFLQSSHLKEVYLSSYLYNLQGEIQNKSLVFMSSPVVYLAKLVLLPASLNYERQQQAPSFEEILKGKSQKDILFLKKVFQNDKQSLFPLQKEILSPSRIKSYRNCPFKYAAENSFYVKETSPIDWELSALEQGSSIHKLFKELLNRYPDLKMTEIQKEQLILEILPKDKHFIHNSQKLLVKQYLKQKLNEFLIEEGEQKDRLPYLKAKALEAKLECFWDQKKGELADKGDYAFKAFVDRIDWDPVTKSYVLRDYKARADNPHIKSWLKKGQEDLQLIFYAQALQLGLIEGCDPGPVVALFYSAYKDSFKAKGFAEKGHPCSKVIKEGRGYAQTAETLKEAMQATKQTLVNIVSKMEEGNFRPQPLKEDLCPNCSYKTWCRFYV